ncbi:MAG: MerR family transcriptional regulator [Clostridiales bacterium]|nr:MerR family transcriptional regulator [Clostridiales bacterium]MCI2161078.1 MerR family transcriptional regulator [Oscillospiraceae bacterium]MCI1961188.1 MerR family transcriptional regulator [Clostridiales bacterium]MCI2021629.1 MerR family transcriptional regulator [Clostridiales bacterium]MCI2026415.1 MerR family transcriptional regulator [Clostridiales bacterium]
MQIGQVQKETGLTRKAIEYAISQGVITPKAMENGYRNFNKQEVDLLKKVKVLRKLGLSGTEIQNVLSDDSTLQKCAAKKDSQIQLEQEKSKILEKLSENFDYQAASKSLENLSQKETIFQKLLDAFPGIYGELFCFHFAPFLKFSIETQEQKQAYEKIVAFLDEIPPFEVPDELSDEIKKSAALLGKEKLHEIELQAQSSIQNIDSFLKENEDMMNHYLTFRQSKEYYNSPAFKIQQLFLKFSQNYGYYTVFLPALRILSPRYCEYCKQMEKAEEKFLQKYPQAKALKKEI